MEHLQKNIAAIIAVSSFLLILSGCGKSESDYKSAISNHMSEKHSSSILSYEEFDMDSNGATAKIKVSATLGYGDGGFIELSKSISLDSECNVSSCSSCNLGM